MAELEPAPAVQGSEAAVPAAEAPFGDAPPSTPRGPRRWPGRLALVLALGMVVAVGIALAIDAPGRYEAATIAATIAIGLSGVALLLGVFAVFSGYGRGAAIAAIVIAVLGNPLVLLYGLGMLR